MLCWRRQCNSSKRRRLSSKLVIPAKAGIQKRYGIIGNLRTRLLTEMSEKFAEQHYDADANHRRTIRWIVGIIAAGSVVNSAILCIGMVSVALLLR